MEWFTELPTMVRFFLIFSTITLISIFVRKTTGINLGLGADQANKSKKCSSCLSVIPLNASRCKNCGEVQALPLNSNNSSNTSTSMEPSEKTCPACISQVPFIASKCKFCGSDLVVEDLSHIKKAFEDTERKEREAENNRRRALEDAERLQKERAAIEQSEKERLRKEHLESLSPLKRFLTIRKIPLTLALIGVIVSALIIPSQISKAREASAKEQARQQAKQSAAAAEESSRADALANAEKNIAEFETQYCQLLNSALKDSEFRRFISNERNDMTEVETDVVNEKYYVDLVEIYTSYTSLGVALGADRANFLSPILELHVGSYGWKNDSTSIIAQCSAY